MSHKVDLNRLRDTIHANQRAGRDKPNEAKKKLYVDANAGIVTGDQKSSNDRRLSEVQQDTFGYNNLSQDRTTVRLKMPHNTKEVRTYEGAVGWFYKIKCQMDNRYEFFLWFDGSYYQVKLISPQLESKWHSVHTGHIYSSGNLCLSNSYNSGAPSLEKAYAKSVLWATGMSVALRTGKFPFNYNQ